MIITVDEVVILNPGDPQVCGASGLVRVCPTPLFLSYIVPTAVRSFRNQVMPHLPLCSPLVKVCVDRKVQVSDLDLITQRDTAPASKLGQLLWKSMIYHVDPCRYVSVVSSGAVFDSLKRVCPETPGSVTYSPGSGDRNETN